MSDKPPLRLEWVHPADLASNPANWRQHPDLQRDALEALLYGEDAVGWAGAALFNEVTGRLIDGHLRREVAAVHDEPIPVLIGSWTEEEERKILATLDPISALAETNRKALGEILQEVKSSESAVQEMLAELAEREGVFFGGNGGGGGEVPEVPPVDRAQELQEVWQVERGQIWQMGEHFVICGDCREAEAWERLLKAAGVDKVNGVFTSPPYAEQRKQQYGGVPVDEYVDWWEAVQANVRASLAGDGSFFVNIKPHCENGQRVLYVFDLVLAMVRWWEWRFVDELCWVSGGYPGNFSPRFKNGFEPIYHFGLGNQLKHRSDNVKEEMTEDNKRKTKWNKDEYGDRGRYYSPTGSKMNLDQSTFDSTYRLPNNVLQVPAARGFLRDGVTIDIHSAIFPVALPDFFIRAYSDTGDVWCDPFLGSGTTIVAAHNNQRIGLGIEVLEKYVSVVLQRYHDLTGLEPVRIG